MKKLFCVISTLLLLLFLLPATSALSINYKGPGLVKAPMLTQTHEVVGIANVWNTKDEFRVRLVPGDSWELRSIKIYVGNDPVPATRKGNLVPGRFNYKDEYANSEGGDYWLKLNLYDDLGITWGQSGEEERLQNVAVHVSAVKLDAEGNPGESHAAWAYSGLGVATRTGEIDEESLTDFEGVGAGWCFTFVAGHPKGGHFIDSPVEGLIAVTPTYYGVTDESGLFDYFPGEEVTLSIGDVVLGTTVADHKISPLDFYPLADTDDTRVINMARLLQSLDRDAYPKSGIQITDDVTAAFDSAMNQLGMQSLDFSNTEAINAVISETLTEAALLGVALAEVSAGSAKAHLDESLNNVMFRKNISKTPDLASSKAKMNIATVWLPAMEANDESAVIDYYDEKGDLIRTAEEAKPLIVTYTDADSVTGEHDVWAAISRDDGATWKRKNLSRTADRSSFTLVNGEPYYGGCKKPVFQVKGNKILVAWSSKYARGGKPRYAIDKEDEYLLDDPYYVEDIWGVGGPQRSHDYTEDGFPEVGEVPHAALWVCRGIIATQDNVDAGFGAFAGEIIWFKPERVTSGRRDVNQIFVGAAGRAGFAMVWQEDPNGVKPGKAVGPGPGWGGATTSHKTDIWYSYLSWGDHSKVDTNFVAGGDPEHDLNVATRLKSLIPMSLPVRLSDNEVVNTDNMMVELDGSGYPDEDLSGNWTPTVNLDADSDGEGTHAYGYEVDGLCEGFYEFTNEQNEQKKVCITDDERLLDGDTGASRGNIFLQPYIKGYKTDGITPIYSAWAIINYEETKGAGAGSPDETGTGENSDAYIPEEGKNVIYHSFDFQNPDLVRAGYIMASPESDANGNLVYLVDETGAQITDYLERPQLAYENSRRARFILQGSGAIESSRTIMLMVYKEGEEGSGRPSDIMMQRWVVPEAGTAEFNDNGDRIDSYFDVTVDNPYSFENIVGDWVQDTKSKQYYRASGPVNMSSVNPTVTTDSMGDPEQDDSYGAVKVVQWEQTKTNLGDPTWLNPYDDARAHRGQIRGDFVLLGFSYTPNWAAARNGNDKYDFFIRRSFDGGETWTTDPSGEGVAHCQTFKAIAEDGSLVHDSDGNIEKEEICTFYEDGAFETMRNLSQLGNAKESVIEPRIVAVPGTIKVSGKWTKIAEDKQNPKVFYVAWGTSTNPKKDPETGEQEEPMPQDLFYSFSRDKGESYYVQEWEINPDSDGNFAGETVERTPWMAKDSQEQGEVQLRMTPDGSRFYASWLDEGDDGSDIVFRRIMSADFPQNVAADTSNTDLGEPEESSADFTSDSGGSDD